MPPKVARRRPAAHPVAAVKAGPRGLRRPAAAVESCFEDGGEVLVHSVPYSDLLFFREIEIYRSNLLEGEDTVDGHPNQPEATRRRMVAYFGRGGYPQRAPGEVLVRDSRQAAEGAPLHSRLPPGVERRLLGSSHQGEEGQRRRGRRMGDQSPVRSPPRRRRVAGPERGSSSGHYGQPQPKEKGSRRRCGKEGREEEEEARQVPEKEQKAKPFQAGGQEEEGEGPQQRSRRQRFRPGPQQTEEGDAESSKVGEEGQEKRELLLNWEFRQGGNALHRVFQRDGRFRCFWSNQDGQKDLDKVPGSSHGDVVVVSSGAAPEHPGTDVGYQQEGTPPTVPSILPSAAGGEDAARYAAGGSTCLLLPRPGAPRPDPRAPGRFGPKAQSLRRPSGRETLDSDLPVRARPGGDGCSSHLHGDRAGGEGSSGVGSPEGPLSTALWEQPSDRPLGGLEEGWLKGEAKQRVRKGERLAKRRQGRWQGLPGQSRSGQRKGQKQGKIAESNNAGNCDEDGSKVIGSMGATVAPEDLNEGPITGPMPPSPGGVGSNANASEFGAKAPSCFTPGQVAVEEEKVGPSQEYPPAVTRSGATNVCSEECSALEGKALVDMGDILNGILDEFHFKGSTHSKPQSSGLVKNCIFPLPLSSEILGNSPYASMARATCRALNLLYGESDDGKSVGPSVARDRALTFICECVEAVGGWSEPFPRISFDIFFNSKGVDYRGEEVKMAKRFCWESISPALPPEVGGVSLVDFCILGTKHYVENFSEYLVPPEKRFLGRPPLVMVDDDDWESVVTGLVNSRVCGIIPISDVCHIGSKPLLGGLFGVGKNEFVGQREVMRLIMNFVPLNENCKPLDSDIATLPGIAGLSPFLLEGGEVALVSSEDIRCFFYLFELPDSWFPFLGFNKLVPAHLVPPEFQGQPCVLHARVLPMGFRNSVGIAQHVHRNVIRQALACASPPITGEGEMRKDKPSTSSRESYRIYLDNFDVIVKTDPETASLVSGEPGLLSLIARQAYTNANLPRHPKKSVCQATKAEVRGCILDGEAGIAYPKPPKVVLYVSLALELLRGGAATQREMQVVCGGFVYFALFRRPLLSALNAVWRFIDGLSGQPPVLRLPLPPEVRLELARFCALVPLARLDFRLRIAGNVTASDASSGGGGACVSTGLTDYGVAAANATVRGDVPEAHDLIQVLSVGLFDGVGCLRMACDVLGLPMAGHISVEKSLEGRRVVEAAFAGTVFVEDVALVDQDMVNEWACRFSQVGLVLVGAGPPCQGVSGLNTDRRGALKDHRSCLYQHVPRIKSLICKAFPWAQVRALMESVASMDKEDRILMSKAVGEIPVRIDAAGVALAHRPRLYWCDWKLLSMEGVEYQKVDNPEWGDFHQISLTAALEARSYLEPGWALQYPTQRLPTFTTSRPSATPGRRPAGLASCTEQEVDRWKNDMHRFPPYQYKDSNCLQHRSGALRVASLVKREVIMGMPAHHTSTCFPKSRRSGAEYTDARLSLIGNAWSVPVVAWIISCLGSILGLCRVFTPQQVVQLCKPGGSGELQQLLLRPPVSRHSTVPDQQGTHLVKKLAGLVSIKGEDLLL